MCFVFWFDARNLVLYHFVLLQRASHQFIAASCQVQALPSNDEDELWLGIITMEERMIGGGSGIEKRL